LDFQARKRFGQNFLVDSNIIQKIVNAIHIKEGDHLVEIGPGLGALTELLISSTGELDVIEIDRDIIPKLSEKCEGLGELRIYNEDALRFDLSRLSELPHSLRIIGNLPYNISTPLTFHLLKYVDEIQDMHLMYQKEVADRMEASLGSKDYGRLSVMVQYCCEVEKLFEVSPQAFKAVPKVDSAVVRLVPRREFALKANNIEHFQNVVRQAFGQRRKMIRNSLKGLVEADALLGLGIDPMIRAERLSVEDFVRISNL